MPGRDIGVFEIEKRWCVTDDNNMIDRHHHHPRCSTITPPRTMVLHYLYYPRYFRSNYNHTIITRAKKEGKKGL